MTSSFKVFTNATLVFQVPNGIVTKNAMGNRVVQTAPVEIKAMLRPVRDAAQINYYVGDDETAELMTGYVTEPLPPPSLHPPVEGKAMVKTAVGVIRNGSFKLLPNSQSPYLVGLKIDTLTKILGVFRCG